MTKQEYIRRADWARQTLEPKSAQLYSKYMASLIMVWATEYDEGFERNPANEDRRLPRREDFNSQEEFEHAQDIYYQE